MKRIALAAAVVIALASTWTATAAQTTTTAQSIRAPKPAPFCLAQTFEVFSGKVWAPSRWERGAPPPSTIDAAHRRIGCAPSAGHRKAMKRTWRRDRSAFYQRRSSELELIALTPYDCGSAGRFAIPCYVVACESGYSWTAYNPSGASGPYQLMPEWGAPYPARTRAEKLEVHRIAGELWAGGAGASNWVCA